MLLNSLPSGRNQRPVPHQPRLSPTAPLHERLFGEHSGGFYVLVALSLSLTAALTTCSLLYAPQRLPEALAGLALPMFYLLQGSPDRRLQATAIAIMGFMVWSQFDMGPFMVAAAAAMTALATFACETAARRAVAAMQSMTRRQRRPNVLRLFAISGFNTALVATPGAVAVYQHLLETGWDAETAGYAVVGGLGLLGFLVYRHLMDELPVPLGG